MSERSIPLLAALLVAASACTHAPPYDPFKTPREKFCPTLAVVALAPLVVPKDLVDAEEIKKKFLYKIHERLQQAGITVIPPWETGPVVEAAMEWRGGFYDPRTGELDAARLRGAREEALQNLAAKHGRVDAILFPDVRVVRAALSHDTARWDGTKQQASTSFFKAMLVTHSGWIPALSLVVRLTGPGGADLYVDAGGIEVLARVGVGGTSQRVPREELFASEGRNDAAVSLALDDLLAAVRQGPAATPAAPPSPDPSPAPSPPAREPATAPDPPARPRPPPGDPAAPT